MPYLGPTTFLSPNLLLGDATDRGLRYIGQPNSQVQVVARILNAALAPHAVSAVITARTLRAAITGHSTSATIVNHDLEPSVTQHALGGS